VRRSIGVTASFTVINCMIYVGKTVSPVVKMLMETLDGSSRADDCVTVGQALAILCQYLHTQVFH
jgi:hypothetical protein